ncbi:MAG: hypothetical protein RLZZ165_170 [Bacteroidota bacterium]
MEQASFVRHRIPGMEGDLAQDMGRASVRLGIEGVFFGDKAADELNGLRNLYKSRKPVDFLAEITGQAYFAQVILEQFEVVQQAGEVSQYSYHLQVAEYVKPNRSTTKTGYANANKLLKKEALNFMDMVKLPDLLSVPSFGDPTPPLGSVMDGLKTSLAPLNEAAATLSKLFGN